MGNGYRNALLGTLLIAVAMASGCGGDHTESRFSDDAGTGGMGGGTGAAGGDGDGSGGNLFTCPADSRCADGTMCCDVGLECVDGVQCLPICETTRCGSSGVLCCDEGQICLDGVVCAAPCATDRAVCGENYDVCCPAGDLCLAETCVTPGDSCQDDFDCLGGGLFCEPTVGRCLQTPEGGADAHAGSACQVRPDFEQVAVEVEWHWPGVMDNSKLYENVIATPVVGDVSGDGIPDVIVPVYTGSSLGDGILVALSGDSGALLWLIGGADAPMAQTPAAVGNFDADPALEVVYELDSDGFRIVDGDGLTELGRRTTDVVGSHTAPSIVDVQGDGIADVVVGCQGLDGSNIGDAALDFYFLDACSLGGRSVTAVANLDADPEPEVTSGGRAFNVDGSSAWTTTGPDGFPAVADLDGDGTPEVVVVQDGVLLVRAGADGSVRIGPGGSWADITVALPGGGTGGPPTIADFDGDGMPEIASAGKAFYTVFDPDCLSTPPRAGGDCTRDDLANDELVRWTTPTQDISSSVTGSSVFDFQGDGPAEVIYNDECFLHVYSGFDGSEPLDAPVPNSSRTDFEYPLVVDVDRDGNSEIVVPANRDQAVSRDNCPSAYAAVLGVDVIDLPAEIATGTSGIYVYGDPFDRWVGTRLIWNQFSYHVSNVERDGAIPVTEPDNWRTAGLNNYRQNVQGEGVFNAPNLRATLDVVTQCTSRTVTLSAVVRNVGSRGVAPGVVVQFYKTAPGNRVLVGEEHTQTALLPGGYERVAVVLADVESGTTLGFEVVVDGATVDGAVIECAEDDNVGTGEGICEVLGPQ